MTTPYFPTHLNSSTSNGIILHSILDNETLTNNRLSSQFKRIIYEGSDLFDERIFPVIDLLVVIVFEDISNINPKQSFGLQE